MHIIDLSIEIKNGMHVFPGDPEVEIENIQTFKKDGWNMKRLHINGHDGTHVNVQIHGLCKGKNLDQYKLEDFIGESVLFESITDIQHDIGLVVAKRNIDKTLAQIIVDRRPKFVGLSSRYELNVDIEKFFFKNDIISFEKVAHTDKLPKRFIFYGVPLKIKNGDGSPVRAYAIIN
jgi:arylformamidase